MKAEDISAGASINQAPQDRARSAYSGGIFSGRLLGLAQKIQGGTFAQWMKTQGNSQPSIMRKE